MPDYVRYSAEIETVAPDERSTIDGLKEQFGHILDATLADYGRGVRAVHAKAHGIACGTLSVVEGLPRELAQGLFAAPGRYDAVMRFSTNPGDILDDAISVPRGLAMKVMEVDGERLPGSERDTTQDFVMANAPAFVARDASQFLSSLKLLAKTTDRVEGGKKLLSAALRGVEAGLEAVGLESATLKTMGAAPQVHPLGETYFSQTAYRYGDHVAKFQVRPVAPALLALRDERIDTKGRPDAIREDVDAALTAHGGAWELRVQLATDPDAMPVEDATVAWDEEASPYRTVALIEIPIQPGWGERQRALDEALAFSPWHGLAAHRPLGNINRARRESYRYSADRRREANGCPLHEPLGI
ncbi:catalase family protein [Sphingomonas sp.]|uniref:catalase family protein n=1 Tax=Sphingomonas sp. TaxID=28214 RepID=UPI002BC1AFD4|nr:catalase family protein [Sphingomonas sp.]HTG38329.1 catalase family protein [Sphingomonas sp.]